ncbi:unnamed protein product [Linum trigynum]|uniref:Uncharacterized protein n=1 Tax=Linum trigynum TaxID=586398 RepID=A0AAV2CD26_9ROSI
MLEGIRGYMMEGVVLKYKMLIKQAWPSIVGYLIHPPKSKSMPGKPKKNHRKAAIEIATRAQWGGNSEEVTRKGTFIHCKRCKAKGHNSRSCKAPIAANEVDVIFNVADRATIQRELRVATIGVGVYVDETTGNQYVGPAGSGPSRRPRGVEANVIELQGSQPPPTQP